MKSMENDMPETMYRASRYLRVLGNPTAYKIIRSLEKSPKSPSELTEELGKTLATTSKTLRNLRQVDLVRYKTQGLTKEYWIKDKGILEVLDKSEALADRMRKKQK